MSLVPHYQKVLPDSDKTKIHFRFYVVHPIGKGWNDEARRLGGLLSLQQPGWVEPMIAFPDGIVLIVDGALAKIDNEAQLSSMLSCAITAVLQKQSYIPRHPHVGLSLDEEDQSSWLLVFAVSRNEQMLRIGIRQMYLAGYDIREAPYAWAVAQGKPVSNPVINSKHPDKEIPWYAAYAFNYISQYYKDVDYSKLKRGRTEYQQFLKELYKADPSLPHPKAPAHARASTPPMQ